MTRQEIHRLGHEWLKRAEVKLLFPGAVQEVAAIRRRYHHCSGWWHLLYFIDEAGSLHACITLYAAPQYFQWNQALGCFEDERFPTLNASRPAT